MSILPVFRRPGGLERLDRKAARHLAHQILGPAHRFLVRLDHHALAVPAKEQGIADAHAQRTAA